jgi:hypothetical protein
VADDEWKAAANALQGIAGGQGLIGGAGFGGMGVSRGSPTMATYASANSITQ